MKYIFGNWKMYLTVEQSIKLAQELVQSVSSHQDFQYAIFPNTLVFSRVYELLKDSSIGIGAQHVAGFPMGAYTGETSPFMFKEMGAQYALIGHSERRHIFGETNEDVRKKIEMCIEAKLVPVVCIGETQEDRAQNKTQYRLKKQLMKALENLSLNGSRLVIAYEPVWAIGSGMPCLPEDADDVIGWIKQEVSQYIHGPIPVLYGGSVSPENVLSYVSHADIDGVLIGGASAKFDAFMEIISQLKKSL